MGGPKCLLSNRSEHNAPTRAWAGRKAQPNINGGYRTHPGKAASARSKSSLTTGSADGCRADQRSPDASVEVTYAHMARWATLRLEYRSRANVVKRKASLHPRRPHPTCQMSRGVPRGMPTGRMRLFLSRRPVGPEPPAGGSRSPTNPTKSSASLSSRPGSDPARTERLHDCPGDGEPSPDRPSPGERSAPCAT